MPFFGDDDPNAEDGGSFPIIGTDLFENPSDDDEEPFDSGPTIPDVLLQAVETVESSVVNLNDEAEQENGADNIDEDDDDEEEEEEEDDDDDDDEDIPTAPMEETVAPSKATPKAKRGAPVSRKRKAGAVNDEPASKRFGRGRAAAAAASSAIRQDLSKRPRAPNGQAKTVPKKSTGAKRGPKPKAVEPDEEYEVERIEDHKRDGKTTLFLVKWKGYSAKDNTWEPESHLAHAAKLLREYEASAEEDKAAPTPKQVAAPKKTAKPKKAPAEKQKPGPKTKKVTAEVAAARPARRGAVRSGRPKKL